MKALIIAGAIIIMCVTGGCNRSPDLPPWTIVCDDKGHYSFTGWDGLVYTERDSRAEAEASMWRWRASAGEDGAKYYEQLKKDRERGPIQWKVCP